MNDAKTLPPQVKLRNYYEDKSEYSFLQSAIAEINAGAPSTKEVCERLCKSYHFDYERGRSLLEKEGYLGENLKQPGLALDIKSDAIIGKVLYQVSNGEIIRGVITSYTVEFPATGTETVSDPFTEEEYCLSWDDAQKRMNGLKAIEWKKEFDSMDPDKLRAFRQYIGEKK